MPAWVVCLLCAAGAMPAASAPNCGVASVVALAEASGRALPTERVTRLTAGSTADQVSMADVQALAATVGIALAGYRATLAEVLEGPMPAIAHLAEPEHFVCVVGGDAAWVQLLDGWSPRLAVVPREEFERRYTGHYLRREAVGEGGGKATLRSRHAEYEQGDAGRELVHRFEVVNAGNQELRLASAGSSCSCTTVDAADRLVAPGGAAEIAVAIRPNVGRGVLEHVTLTTNDPTCPVLYLSIRIQSVPQNIRLLPSSLYLGLDAGGHARTRFRLLGPPGLRIRSASAQPDVAEVRIIERRHEDERAAYTFQVDSLGGLTCGRHEARVLVYTDLDDDEPIAVPLVIVVADAVRVRPSRVAALDLEPGPYEAEFRVESVGIRLAQVTGALVEGLPLEAELSRQSLGFYLVRLRGDLAPGVHRGRLVVRTDLETQPEVSVPITLAVTAG